MRYYFNEGHVEEEIRKIYPYKQKLIPYYRKIFELRKQIDDEELVDAVDKLEAKGYDLEEMGYGPLLQKLQMQSEKVSPEGMPATEASVPVSTPITEPKAE